MLQIVFVNDGTGDEIAANYDYVISVNGVDIARGHIDNHNRYSGWPGLVSILAKDVFDEEGSPPLQTIRWEKSA